jgi:hypothetical protein
MAIAGDNVMSVIRNFSSPEEKPSATEKSG